MEIIDLIRQFRPFTSQLVLFMTLMVAFLALYSLKDIKKAPIENQKLLYLCSAGLFTGSFLFLNSVNAFWAFFVTLGFLVSMVILGKSSFKRQKACSVFPLSLPIIAVFGILLGFSPIITAGPSMWPTAPKGFSVGILDVKDIKLNYGSDIEFIVKDNDGNINSWPIGAYRKRIWAMPGDEIAIKDSRIYLNSKLIANCNDKNNQISQNVWWCEVSWPNNKKTMIAWGKSNEFWFNQFYKKLSQTEVFVMGDNTVESSDSRDFGPIQKSQIRGEFVL